MSFPKYQTYRDSQVDWIGTVPSEWHVAPLKSLARVINGYPFDAALFDPSEGYPLIRIRDLNQSAPDARYKGVFVAAASIDNDDVLVGMDGEFNVGRWFGEVPALLNQRMCCIRAPTRTVTRYLQYVLPTPLKAINDVTYSTTVKHLSSFDVLRIRVAMPPTRSEVQAVVDFLDRETAKIDALVEEQRRLIELLKEKRQAVISRAVTKGLNPNVQMKDSGVEWLGEVPAHWVVCALRRVVASIEQGWSPECEASPADEQSWGVLKAGCVNRGVFDPSENKSLPHSLTPVPEYEVRSGDVLVSRASGSPELVGSTALVGETRGRLMLSDKIFRVHLTPQMASNFFVWAMNGKALRDQIERALSGGNGLANNLPQSSMLAFLVAVPPIGEQGVIASTVDHAVSKCDALIAEADGAVALLLERRSALISATVTGKIDVRGLAPQ